MKRIDAAGFEAKFRESIDPWNYAASPFERFKQRVLVRACGDAVHGRALEFGCAIGETSRALAPTCLRLLGVDASPTALAEAARRNGGNKRIAFRRCLLPDEAPRGPFDLVVLSEVAYYLTERDLATLMHGIRRIVAPGGRVVVLHHLSPFDDASQPPALAQARACRLLARTMRRVSTARHARFECAAYRRPR